MLRKSILLTILLMTLSLAWACQAETQPPPTSTSTQAAASQPAATAEITPIPIPDLTASAVTLDDSLDLEAFPLNGCLIFHFNQAMDPDSTPLPVRINPLISGQVAWDEAHQTLTFLPEKKFNQFTVYQVRLASDLLSASGAAFAEPPSWSLQADPGSPIPAACGDALAEAELIINPAPSATVFYRRPITVYLPPDDLSFALDFIYPMDHASVEQALSVYPQVPLFFEWQDRSLNVRLGEETVPGITYYFELSDAAMTSGGVQQPTKSWQYTTALPVIEFNRLEGSSRLEPFRIHFGYSMDPASVVQALVVQPAFEYQLAWDDLFRSVELVPLEPLLPETRYTFSIQPEAQFSTGATFLQEPVVWEFFSPVLAMEWQGTTDASRQTVLELHSSVALDTASVEQALQVTPAFEYRLDWNLPHTGLTILPLEPLPSLETFTLSLTGPVLDKDGFPIETASLYHYTVPGPVHNIPPQVEYLQGSRPVEPEAPLVISFDRAMDPTTTLAGLSISPTIPGEYLWSDAQNLEIIPTAGHLDEYTEYTFSLEPGIRDAAGEIVIPQVYSWTLRTWGLPNLASFGEYGSGVQVLDLDGRRALQLLTDLENVQLELYRITLQQFITLDTNTFQVPWAYDQPRSYDLGAAALQTRLELPVRVSQGYSYRTSAEILLPPDLPTGLYVANLVSDHLDDQLLLVLTRSSVAAKYAPRPGGGGELLAWVSDINDFVMQNAEVRVYDRVGNQITSGVTDAFGLFQTVLPPGSDPYLVAARRDGDLTLTGISSVWRTRGSYWGIPRQLTTQNYFAYLYTDRPLYRPGQMVHYKGILRLDRDGDYALPAQDLSASLVLRDSRNNLLASQPVTLNEFGTFSGTFQLAEGSLLGTYHLELVIGSESHYGSFEVQEYRKPDIQVSVRTDRQAYARGEPIEVTIQADYLFGEPVAGANLAVDFYTLLPKYYAYYYQQDPGADEEYTWFATDQATVELTTDQNGRASFIIEDQLVPYPYDYEDVTFIRWGIEVQVDDNSQQEISAMASFTVHRTAAEVNLDTGGFLFSPQAPIPVTVRLSSRFDNPIAEQPLRLEIKRPASGSYYNYETIDTIQLTTDSSGLAQAVLELESGMYRLVLFGEDSYGQALESTRYLWVYEFGSTWLLDFQTDLSLEVEARPYHAGESAQILIRSNFSGEGLLTIERGGILEARMLRFEAPFTTIEVPIRPEYAPNVFVLLQAWVPQDTDITSLNYAYESIPDSLLRWDAVELEVPDLTHKLQVEITPDREVYAPRSEASFTVRVSDAQGKPAQAELSLALVDEAIFLLAADPAGEIHQAFYQPRKLGVFSYDSLAPWRVLYAPERGGGGGGGEGLPGNPRSDFPDSVLWLPAVITSADGLANVTVTLPDNLTTWRLTVKAVTRETRVGEGLATITTQQAVVVRPLPPRSLTAGDSFLLSASIHNYSTERLELEVSLQASGLELASDDVYSLQLDPGVSQFVSWPARASHAGQASFTIQASSADGGGNGRSDAVQLQIPVQPLAVREQVTYTGIFAGQTSLLLPSASEALPQSQLRIEVQAGVAGSLLNGIEYLTGFPYGCVEQTMSRALPNAVVARAFQELGLQERLTYLQLDAKIQASLQRLYGFQHTDGGWGWFYDDPSSSYQTAWVIFGLTTMQQAGYQVEPAVIASGVAYLQEQLASMDPATRVYTLAALSSAGVEDLAWMQYHAQNSNYLDYFSRANLALILYRAGDLENAQRLLDDLLAETKFSDTDGIYLPGGQWDGYISYKYMASEVRATAMLLQALLAINPEHDYRSGLVQWLLDQRSYWGWGSTNETAHTILALSDHLRAEQLQAVNTQVEILLNGESLVSQAFRAETPFIRLDLPASLLVQEENELRLLADQAFDLNYLVSSQSWFEQAELEAAGIEINRQYLDPETREPLTSIQEGDLVLVELTVRVRETGFYILLEDHLPGGLEAIAEGFNTTAHDIQAVAYEQSYYDRFRYANLGYNQKEIYPDRVVFFITELGKGSRTVRYYARATVAGEFTALPAEISAMYAPQFWGRSATQQITILPNSER